VGLVELKEVEELGFKKAIIEWKDPCLVMGVSLTHYENKLYRFYTIGWFRQDPKNEGIYNIVFKIDRSEFPEGQNTFLNVPEGNIVNIVELYTKDEAIRELENHGT